MPPIVDIVIVSYKDEIEIRNCIKSIEEHCHNYNLIVINNNQFNRGYTAACNLGIKQGSAPYIWLLNSDAVVMPQAQDMLIDRFVQSPDAGIVASTQLDPENPDRVTHAGCTRIWPSGVHKGGYLSKGFLLRSEKQIWVNGASMMLRREMVNEIGLMDEDLFIYYSDSDYCLTARLNGWEVWHEAGSIVMHTLKASARPSEWLFRDAKAFADKWGIGIDGVGGGRFIVSQTFQALANSI